MRAKSRADEIASSTAGCVEHVAAEYTPIQLEHALRIFRADECSKGLSFFVKEAWPILAPGRELVWSPHYDLLCEYLTLVNRRVIKRLIINIPPRTLKSVLVTVVFPVWVWLTDPAQHFLMASYSQKLSSEHALNRRNLLETEKFHQLFADRVQLSPRRRRVERFANTRGGQMFATSVGGSTMGFGCDCAILDDPINATQALSDSQRTAANQWIYSTLRSRLNDPSEGAIILVMQRLHESDPTGFLLDQEPGTWTHIRLPLIAEEDESWIFPISGRVFERERGQVLMPSRYSPTTIKELQSQRLVFAGQYQQRPVPLEGNLVRTNEIKYYGGVDPKNSECDPSLPYDLECTLISVDCAFKDHSSSDFVAIGVIGVKGPNRYVLNVVNAHLDVAGTIREIQNQMQQHPSGFVLIEDAANGSAIIQMMKNKIPGIVPIKPEGGKVARMYAAAGEWQAGNWWVDRNAVWSQVFLEQLLTFPNGKHDDMVDMMSQAAAWLLDRSRYMCNFSITDAYSGRPLY